MKLSVDFFGGCAILFPMSEENTMSKVHGARWSPQALAIEKRKELKREWESIHPIDRPDWESFKRGIWKGRKLSRIWPMADMADRERRAKEWAEHLAKKSEINA